MSAEANLHPAQFAPRNKSITYYGDDNHWAASAHRLTPEGVAREKGHARNELHAAREARLAGRQSAAEGHRRWAAVYREHALAAATHNYHSTKSGRMAGDIKDTRRLP